MKRRPLLDPDVVDVLPPRVREGALTVCACQYGPGGSEEPATYLVSRAGQVPMDYRTAQVWEVGHRHRWVCPCHRAGHQGLPGEDVQTDLLDLLAGAA